MVDIKTRLSQTRDALADVAIDRDQVMIDWSPLPNHVETSLSFDPEEARRVAVAFLYSADCIDGKVNSWEEWDELHPDIIGAARGDRVRITMRRGMTKFSELQSKVEHVH